MTHRHPHSIEESLDITVETQQPKESTNWHRPFWRSVVSSEFGTGSTSRISAFLIVLVSLGIVSYLVVRTGSIPQHLMELGGFSALLITSVYSPAKVAGIFKSIKK